MRILFLFILVSCLSACSLFEVTDEDIIHIQDHSEFEDKIKVKKIEVKEEVIIPKISAVKEKQKKKSSQKPTIKKKLEKKPKIKEKITRLPEIEDSKGFLGRRPEIDPFVVGEEIILDLSYFKMEAGKLTFKVLPFVEVNGRKAYHFQVSIKSSKLFSMFYKLDNVAETYIDYETLRPFSHSVHLKESGQVKEARSYFDWDNLEASYWEKRVTKDKGKENKKQKWKIKNYSQNVISALFYFRVFQLEVGNKIKFYVADDKKNITFEGKVIREEIINTEVGNVKTIILKPEFIVDGAFKPVGDIYFWLSKDNKKQLLKIESKIKIGTIKAAISSRK